MSTRLSEFAALVHGILNDSTVHRLDDVESLAKHQVKRRIVWLTQGGTTEPPHQAGGRKPSDGSEARVRACRIRVEQVDAHIFAENRDSAERLLDNVIAAVCLVARVVEIPSYKWTTQEVASAGKTLRAEECVLRINLRLPVPDEITPLGVFTLVDDICGTIQVDDSVLPQDAEP